MGVLKLQYGNEVDIPIYRNKATLRVVYRAVTNGTVVEETNYDPWGRIRNENWEYEDNLTGLTLIPRGYTGHEHLQHFALINMNGRMYDPVIGRMLSPDNYVQDPSNAQNYNRYAYVLNNPLKYTDPSGEFWGMAIFGVTFLTQYAENALNGVDNPGKSAYTYASSIVNNISNAFQVGIYQNDNTSLSVGFDMLSIGLGFNVSHKNENMSYSASGGYGLGGWFASVGASYTDDKDWTYGFGIGVGKNYWAVGGNVVNDKGYGFGYYQTRYGEALGPDGFTNKQVVGGVKFYLGDASVSLENDFLAKGEDRWRSNAIEISVNEFSIGTHLYNNDPKNTYGEDDYSYENKSPVWGYNRTLKTKSSSKMMGGWNHGYTYSSPIYLGYKYGNTIDRIGYSHHAFQDAIQNGVHKWVGFGRQNYYSNYSKFNYGMYFYSGWYNQYSIWGR